VKAYKPKAEVKQAEETINSEDLGQIEGSIQVLSPNISVIKDGKD